MKWWNGILTHDNRWIPVTSSSRPPPAHNSGIRLPPFLRPAEIAFVGQVVSRVNPTGIIIDKVGRISNGGLRFHSRHGERHYIHDMLLSASDSDAWAYKLPSGAPVNAGDFAETIKKYYRR